MSNDIRELNATRYGNYMICQLTDSHNTNFFMGFGVRSPGNLGHIANVLRSEDQYLSIHYSLIEAEAAVKRYKSADERRAKARGPRGV